MADLTALEIIQYIDPSQLDYQEYGYTVYIHINKVNGKKYIGITKRPVIKRWKNGRGYYKQEHFYKAIKKYGWNNFHHLVVATGLTQEKAEKLECELISKHNALDFRYGYNKTTGGGLNRTCSEETRKKLSLANKKTCGPNHPMYGKQPSKETRAKQSIAHIGQKPWNKGKPMSPELIKINSLSHLGINRGSDNPKAKKVICLNNGLIFGSVIEAAQNYGMKTRGQHICSCCNGKRLSCGKDPQTGVPLRWAYVDDNGGVINE